MFAYFHWYFRIWYFWISSNICIFLPIFEIGITSCTSRTCGCHPPFAYFHRELLWRLGAFATTRKLRDPLLIKIMASSTLHENTTQIVEVNRVTNFVMGFFYITLSFCYSVCPLSIFINLWPLALIDNRKLQVAGLVEGLYICLCVQAGKICI